MDMLSLFKPALYPITVSNDEQESSPVPHVLSLVDTCCRKIVHDSSATKVAILAVPREICYSLMKAALSLGRDRAIEVLVAQWPSPVLTLRKFAPPLFSRHSVRYNDSHLAAAMTRGMKFTTCLAHTFVECLKNRSPTQLKCLDLTGYPVAEVIVNYLASHVLLAYNETKQNEIIQQYNRLTEDLPDDQRQNYDVTSIMPDHSYVILVDMRLEHRDTHLEACRALKISNNPNCKFRLRPQLLDMNGLGVARLCVLLDQLPPECLQSLGLQFNWIKDEGFELFLPFLQKFTSLTALDLSYNALNVNAAVCENLRKLFRSLPHLRRLDLASNRLKRYYRPVLDALVMPLEFLNITFCAICEEDLQYLSQSRHSKSITELKMADNVVNTDRFPDFLHMIAAFKSQLQYLDVSGCLAEYMHLRTFFRHLTIMQELKYLCLTTVELPRDILLEAVDSVAKITSFTTLKALFPKDILETNDETDISEDYSVIEPRKREFCEFLENHVAQLCTRLGRSKFQVVLR